MVVKAKMSFTVFGLFNLPQDRFFTFNLYYLSLVGLWSFDNWSKKQLLLYKIYEGSLHAISIYYLIITGIGTYQCKNDIPIFMSNLDKTLVAYNFVLKAVVFIVYRHPMRILINEIEYSGDKITEERKKLMCYHVVFITILSSCIVSVFLGLGIIKGELVVEAWMPFDPKKNMMNFLLSSQIIVFTFVAPLYRAFALQGIVCSLIMYICDQLVELQKRLRALNYSTENEIAMREEFKKILDKHVRLMGYSKSLRQMLNEYFLIQNLAISVELCLNATMVIVVGFEQKTLLATFIAFLFIALLNAYIYCYLGNDMILQSEAIAQAAYETNWTSWPLDLQKDLVILIGAAQKPLSLSAGGLAEMSLKTYSQALYNGYSIFAVLNDALE